MKKHLADWLAIWTTLPDFRWFRRWHGGRWELWDIDLCMATIWLRINPALPDDHRQPCSWGPRLAREDWPEK